MSNLDVKEILKSMTLEEKAGLCSGSDFWHTKAVERLGIESVMLSDGPHGLRKQTGAGDHLGLGESVEAVAFPAGCAMASSFDRNLVENVGKTLGEECQAEDLSVLLGPPSISSVIRYAGGILNIFPRTRISPERWPPPISMACRAGMWELQSSISH